MSNKASNQPDESPCTLVNRKLSIENATEGRKREEEGIDDIDKQCRPRRQAELVLLIYVFEVSIISWCIQCPLVENTLDAPKRNATFKGKSYSEPSIKRTRSDDKDSQTESSSSSGFLFAIQPLLLPSWQCSNGG